MGILSYIIISYLILSYLIYSHSNPHVQIEAACFNLEQDAAWSVISSDYNQLLLTAGL